MIEEKIEERREEKRREVHKESAVGFKGSEEGRNKSGLSKLIAAIKLIKNTN
jgi:hypothetical protein